MAEILIVAEGEALASVVTDARSAGRRVGFVPTMGALHAGHGALIRMAAGRAECVVVSVFVNPTQFGPNEDLARYPRTLDADVKLCAEYGAHVVFAPPPEVMYPPGFGTFVEVQGVTGVLCGPSRPGHFRGVATVVLKLLNMVRPDFAVFGQKDTQQVVVIQRMVRDLNVPTEIVVAPTVREADGLAMSSRNRYLDPTQRREAAAIHRTLWGIESRVAFGVKDVAALEGELRAALSAIPGARLDYASILDAETLEPIATLQRPALAAVAVFMGTTRLIDNVILTPP